ncbi:MAG: tripartite tricarboxylate transporter substrate binding protein [Betaproteobacteria bacterium]|nr:tripartite tricarboxylate transporter substrate binding protein [Betaproteobacteria bacterium]
MTLLPARRFPAFPALRVRHAAQVAPLAIAMLSASFSLAPADALAQPAQAWPVRPVRLIVPFPPGGAADIVARVVAGNLGESLRHQVLVENRPGAGTNLGPAYVSKAAPDGYTLLLAAVTNHAVASNVYASPGYDLAKSFAPVALLANAPHVLVAHPSLPVKTVRDVIALAKARPRELAFGSLGSGTLAHLEIELLQGLTGVEFTHVPYKGSAPAKADIVAGNIQLMFDSYASASSLLKEGRLRVVAIASDRRSAFLPDVPTFIESGIKQYAANNFYGLMAPLGTPKAIVDRLADETAKILQLAETRERFASLGLEFTPGGPARLAEVIASDLSTWGPVAKRAGVKVD